MIVTWSRRLLLAAIVFRVWLMALPSSLWVDEIVTFFVIKHPGDPSFAVAPQVPMSLYYQLPAWSVALLGNSEIALRLPSVLAMAAALFFVARIAARLIHPDAAWLTVFVCLAFRNFDYFAADARPYGLGIAIASASLLFLIRWLDRDRWLDGVAFLLLAALLWRVHLFYWPFYLVYGIYSTVRFLRRDTPVSLGRLAVATVLLLASLTPVGMTAVAIARGAQSHSFNPLPTPRNLFYLLHLQVILICLAAGWAVSRFAFPIRRPDRTEYALPLAWWLVCPVALFLYSRFSGNGVLIMRYVSLMLPGVALTVTAIAVRFLPENWWSRAALAAGTAALLFLGQWKVTWPVHDFDNWRAAAQRERTVSGPDTPILCPSPFIEARSPAWSPDYRLPGFLYAHLTYYPLRGRIKPFPFEMSSESEAYAKRLLRGDLTTSGRFVLYGSTKALRPLVAWLNSQPELAAWRGQTRTFDEISVILFLAPGQPG